MTEKDSKIKNSLKAKSYKLKASGGFTLIELMVSIGVFAIVVGVMSSMLMTSLRGQKKSTTAQNTADNVRFAMEMMSKEIRMGEEFSANDNNGACGAGIKCHLTFKSTMPNRYKQSVEFYLNTVSNQIMFDDDTTQGPNADAITSALNLSVTSLVFDVTGVASDANNHQRVTIVMRAKSAGTTNDVSTNYDIQTTLSPRKL